MKCPKCNDTSYFEQKNYLTGNNINVPCLCPIKVSKKETIKCEKIRLKLGEDFIIK